MKTFEQIMTEMSGAGSMKHWQRINPWLAVSTVRNEAPENEPVEMLIYDRIGKDPYDESGTGAQDFNAALKAVPAGRKVTVRINSPGGDVWDGMAIYNMLRGMKDRVTCQVDGIAASSASLIALGGGTLRMPKASLMMIHNPQDVCFGNSKEMRARADKLDQHKAAIASIYVENSTMTLAQVEAAMDAETWMTGQQCLDCKMADEITEDEPVQNTFDLSAYRRVPERVGKETNAPQNAGATKEKDQVMNRNEMIALLAAKGVTVPENCTDKWLVDEVKKLVAPVAATPAPAPAPVTAPDNGARMAAIEAQLAAERNNRITATVNGLVGEMRLTALEAPAAIARATADESYLTELRARPQMLPGNAPLNFGVEVVAEDARNSIAAMGRHIVSGPQCAAMSREDHVRRGQAITTIFTKERERLLPVLNTAATNTIDASLKRVLILNETIRDFAIRVLPLRLFSTVFSNVPLQGTDTVAVPYYPLQTVASSDRTASSIPTYVFGQATTTNRALISINKLKYQPLDYSSQEFRRQPWFDAVRLGKINAEKLGVDVVNDVLSVVTAANFGAAAKTAAAAAFTSDDVVDVRGACNAAMWPNMGRSLIVDSTVDTSLQKDSAYKLALNIGTPSVIQQGQFPNLSGFDYAWVPSLPANSEKLIGFAAFASGILAAFAPIDPAPGVRAQLVSYEVVTDPATGISFNYRHWGVAADDRDYEVVECAYGYQAGVSAAVKRIVAP